jgi:hypothetical protein
MNANSLNIVRIQGNQLVISEKLFRFVFYYKGPSIRGNLPLLHLQFVLPWFSQEHHVQGDEGFKILKGMISVSRRKWKIETEKKFM